MSAVAAVSMLRWTARVWTCASLLFVGAFVIGDVSSSGVWPTVTEWVGLAFFPIGVSVGLVFALWKERVGGGMAIMSLVGFYAWHAVVSGQFARGPWFVLVAAPGLLFLAAGLLDRSQAIKGGRSHLWLVGRFGG